MPPTALDLSLRAMRPPRTLSQLPLLSNPTLRLLARQQLLFEHDHLWRKCTQVKLTKAQPASQIPVCV